ncbi:unnamed protein product [Prorocentrum cordatum]|uniref:Secreted protein n=1 Tax=Prorocentrum cordatum TaxID=2364126 RepID=A0ABN9UTA3_9DINO|nr:unnamed protein product [Polarella glacialis]
MAPPCKSECNAWLFAMMATTANRWAAMTPLRTGFSRSWTEKQDECARQGKQSEAKEQRGEVRKGRNDEIGVREAIRTYALLRVPRPRHSLTAAICVQVWRQLQACFLLLLIIISSKTSYTFRP